MKKRFMSLMMAAFFCIVLMVQSVSADAPLQLSSDSVIAPFGSYIISGGSSSSSKPSAGKLNYEGSITCIGANSCGVKVILYERTNTGTWKNVSSISTSKYSSTTHCGAGTTYGSAVSGNYYYISVEGWAENSTYGYEYKTYNGSTFVY